MNNIAPPSPLQQPTTPPLHQSDADDDDENVKQLQECSSLYLSLQDCLVNSNRNWRSCQKEVQALKACNEKRKENDRGK
uniref:CHCH domain-containing protein n=1 Tax=Rhizophora mucronata TaxID=61149 RepID=A0A2P2QUJ7_RHIMU